MRQTNDGVDSKILPQKSHIYSVPVRDHKRRAALGLLEVVESGLDHDLGGLVKRGRRLVQEEDGGVLDHCDVAMCATEVGG